MDSRQAEAGTPSSDSRDTDEPAPPGIPDSEQHYQALDPNKKLGSGKPLLTLKGIENAKKRLRAFSIQKRAPLSPAPVVKPSTSTSSNTVLIGKLSSIKPSQPKPEDPDVKKPPKPPKPGKKIAHGTDSYRELQKKTLAEIEDLKSKMELVELGIPLGLIYPTSGAINDKAMPTKAMPPIKSFLDPKKIDEIIRDAKKARAEGKEFKFNYNKLLPDYDNPFQRKKEEEIKKEDEKKSDSPQNPDKYKNKRRSHYEKSESRRHSNKQDDRGRHSDKSSGKSSEGHSRSKDKKTSEKPKATKDPDDDLKGFVVCDSWSLDNEEKTNSSSPRVEDILDREDTSHSSDKSQNQPVQEIPEVSNDSDLKIETDDLQNELLLPPKKIEKLQPVIDSFKFEIDEPNEDDIIDLYDIPLPKKKRYQSPSSKTLDDDQSKDGTNDSMNDETFLEDIINEIKKENIDDDLSPEKGLVEYEMSPAKDDDDTSKSSRLGSVTPELDDNMRELQFSQRSNYSDGYRSGESGYKSVESGYKSGNSSRSSENYRMSMDKDLEDTMDSKITKATAESLETWSFVLKICQPLLFRHDKNKCYKETRTTPKLWYAEAAKQCLCVKDRMIVYSELETCKTSLVETLYGCDQLTDSPFPTARSWYPRKALESTESATVPVASEWEDDTVSYDRRERGVAEDKAESSRGEVPQQNEMSLDTEYQRFMESVWPGVASKADSRSTTPTQEAKQSHKETDDKRKGKKLKLSSEGWSQESDVEEQEVSKKPKSKEAKEKSRKRKHSVSVSSESEQEETPKKKKKSDKKKEKKKSKSKLAKTKRNAKKMKKLKQKHKKKKKSLESFADVNQKDNKKKDHKKSKKKKQLKLKKKDTKKKKAKAKSSSTESSSSSSTETSSEDTESSAELKRKKKKKDTQTKKKKKDKKRDVTSSDSAQSEDLFDVNILKNIKKERETDDEKCNKMAEQEFSPRRQVMKRPEIINVKELQNDFVGNNIHIKQEVIEEDSVRDEVMDESTENTEEDTVEKQDFEVSEKESKEEKSDFKEPNEIPLIKPILDESNQSQSSSQASHESISSIKLPVYEKDDSHLRPSSQNSNYSFNDVIASQNVAYSKCEENVSEEIYEPENYDVYEQMALAYQNDVANQQNSEPVPESTEQRIETVVRARVTGEIKCDWRVGDDNNVDPNRPRRPSRWGLKPGEANIVLTGANSRQFSNSTSEQKTDRNVYQIESVVNRNDSSCSMSYDEAYMDTYGELDRLQYGDCFGDISAVPPPQPEPPKVEKRLSTLDARIDLALKNTVLGEVAKDTEEPVMEEKDVPEKGILVMKSLSESKGFKSVSFADGYKPGQDSDVEDPPKKKKRKRRYGCAWPCPATHPDHVSLWDALPPPPPPASPPPASIHQPPPTNIPLPMNQMPMPQQMPPQMGPPIGPPMGPPMGSLGPPIGSLGPIMNNIRMPQDMPMGSMNNIRMPQDMSMGSINNIRMPQDMSMGSINNIRMPQDMSMGSINNIRMPQDMSMGSINNIRMPQDMSMGSINNIRMPQDMPMGSMPMGQQMSMNGPPLSMNQQMQINQQLQMINNMRMGQEIPMGQMQVQMPNQMIPPHPGQMKFDPATSLPNFMPPEPPPGLLTFN